MRYVCLALLLSPAWAAKDYVPEKTAEAEKKEAVADGWSFKLNVAGTGSVTHNDQVVGLEDGSTLQLGLVIDGAANLREGQHGWENTLAITHTQMRQPQIDEWVKSADTLTFRSIYRYYLPSMPWLGPFARYRLETAIFPGEAVFAAEKQVQRDGAVTTDDTGAEVADTTTETRLDLTGAFEPLVMRESAGLFADPIDSKALKLGFTLGGGAQHTLTRGGTVISDDGDTDQLEVTTLNDGTITEVGAELEATASGQAADNLTWSLGANILAPFFTEPDSGKDFADTINAEFGGKLSLRLAKWASLDYVFSAKRLPAVLTSSRSRTASCSAPASRCSSERGERKGGVSGIGPTQG